MTITEQVKDWAKTNDYFANNIEKNGVDVFVPAANIYPHIHMGKNFITYSKSSSNHSELCRGDQVFKERINTAQQDTKNPYIDQVCRYMITNFGS